MSATRFGLVLAALALIAPTQALASSILLITAGDSANNAMIVSTLQAQGDTVTVGPTFNNFTGSGLSGYNEVMLMPGNAQVSLNNTQYSAVDMPTSGQQALVNFVNAGGGLVTGEDLVSLTTYPFNDFKTLSAVIPVLPTDIATSNRGITFSSLTSDPVLNAGLPSTFSFNASNTSWDTESYFLPKSGATPLFTTNQWTSTFGGYGIAYGAIGWAYGKGRVISLSTGSDSTELADPNYDQLLRNASNWATQTTGTLPVSSPTSPTPTPTPEPTTLAVLGLGVAGFLARRWARRRRA